LVQNTRSNAFWPSAAPSLTWNPHQAAKRLLLIHTDLLNIATCIDKIDNAAIWRGDDVNPELVMSYGDTFHRLM
jgi:hypothetical protein